MSTTIDAAHLRLRTEHFAMLTPRHWRMWQTYGPFQFVAARLSWCGYTAKPTRYVDWPGGWFVEMDDGATLFVPVVFRDRGHCATYPRPIVEVVSPKLPPTVAEVIGGSIVALLCVLVIPFLSLFFA